MVKLCYMLEQSFREGMQSGERISKDNGKALLNVQEQRFR